MFETFQLHKRIALELLIFLTPRGVDRLICIQSEKRELPIQDFNFKIHSNPGLVRKSWGLPVTLGPDRW